jgi:hypothetical protein
VVAFASEDKKAKAIANAAMILMTFSPCAETAKFKPRVGRKLDPLARRRKTF